MLQEIKATINYKAEKRKEIFCYNINTKINNKNKTKMLQKIFFEEKIYLNLPDSPAPTWLLP